VANWSTKLNQTQWERFMTNKGDQRRWYHALLKFKEEANRGY
jgi:hypothetical protein